MRCREKSCCTYYAVYLTGDEIVRLARMLDAPPWVFTIAVPSQAAPDAFALDHSDKRYRAALTKLPDAAERERCIFLLRLSDGVARCGLGETRPLPCRMFPVELDYGALRVSAEGCTCRSWSLDDIDAEADRALLQLDAAARSRYAELVSKWNWYVAATDIEGLSYQDYCRFLLAQYVAAQ